VILIVTLSCGVIKVSKNTKLLLYFLLLDEGLKISVILFCSVIFFTGCNNNSVSPNHAKVTDPENIDAEIISVVTQILNSHQYDSVIIVSNRPLFCYPFFKNSLSKLVFTKKGKLSPVGDSLYNIIQHARRYGLIPQDYFWDTLSTLQNNFFEKNGSVYNITALAHAELLLHEAYFKFGAHLNKGRFNKDTLLREWRPQKLDSNWLGILKFGLEKNQISKAFDSLEPRHDGYHFLKKSLRKFIAQNEKLNWDSISFYNIKDTTTFLQKLKQRLIISGYYSDTIHKNDSLKLSAAIKLFQKDRNLEPDGKLGKYTKQALSLDKESTIRQIEMALERWRWEPTKYPNRYAVVNIPSAQINVWEWDKKQKVDTLVLNSKIVVGKPDKQTPELSSKINFIMVYPYWNVPYKIAWEEILPMVQRDTNYLYKKNFEVISGKDNVVTAPGKLNWRRFNRDYLPIKFRQRIGNENSLGICKFNFPNKYGVYLHDTNSKRYFKTFYRYQSHGCIRLEKFTDLARFLIRDDTLKIPYDTLDVYFARQQQQQINMRKPLPLYVRYFSASADSSLKLNLYLDIYRKDEAMAKMLY
jgi:L,D-transpeptidase YcbB